MSVEPLSGASASQASTMSFVFASITTLRYSPSMTPANSAPSSIPTTK